MDYIVFVEGPDDERFIKHIYSHKLGAYRIVQCSTAKKDKINSLIKSITCMKQIGMDYIFLADSDGVSISKKRQNILSLYPALINSKLFLIETEVESWYYAGITQELSVKLKMKNYDSYPVISITKEGFDCKLPQKCNRIAIMINILQNYDLMLALERNSSLATFNNYL